MPLTLRSDAFAPGAAIPAEFTCDGANQSPPLAWDTVPEGAQSFALVAHDPDAPAGDLTHWLLFNLPPEARHLPAGVEGEGTPGANSMDGTGYTGPCPPPGNAPHRYVFTLYALRTDRLPLDDSATREAVENAFEHDILEQAQLIGMYARAGE